MLQEILTYVIISGTLTLFILDRWRYDLVAMMALLAAVITGIVPSAQAFYGFGHPAVITVAAVLVISQGLLKSGAVDIVARMVARTGSGQTMQVLMLTALVALFSGVMNNIGALALFLPVGIRAAAKTGRSVSTLLMPLAFGSILGGMLTLIGTPPNIIIAMARAETTGEPFRMFDFLPVSAGAVAVCVLFIGLFGWRLIPRRKGEGQDGQAFKVEAYMSEVRVPPECEFAGKPLTELAHKGPSEVLVVAIIRGGRTYAAPAGYMALHEGDILIIEADSQELQEFVEQTGMELVPNKELGPEVLGSGDIGTIEAVVMPDSPMVGSHARHLNLRLHYGLNLLAIARQGKRILSRLSNARFHAGDVLLLQGREQNAHEMLSKLGCLPLAERKLGLGREPRVLLAAGLFTGGLLLAVFRLLPIHVALTSVALSMVLVRLISLREIYESIDWPIVVLLGAMIPVGEALKTTGGAARIAQGLVAVCEFLPPAMSLLLIMLVTVVLTNIINNAAAAVLMAPIAVGLAQGMGASVDPFLIAVGIAASTAYLTPTGHQSNVLVMGPGGYRYGDYWRLGLPVTLLVLAASLPLILYFWPMH